MGLITRLSALSSENQSLDVINIKRTSGVCTVVTGMQLSALHINRANTQIISYSSGDLSKHKEELMPSGGKKSLTEILEYFPFRNFENNTKHCQALD